MRKSRCVNVCLVAAVAAWGCFGGPARPCLHAVRQSDGTVVRVRARGDETCHWHEDADGYAVVRDRKSRDWLYAHLDGAGEFTQTVHRVGHAKPERLGLERGVRPKSKRRPRHHASGPARSSSSGGASSSSASASAVSTVRTGVLSNLVILVEFPDLKFRYSADDFDVLYNETDYSGEGQHGSVKDYFSEVSYGKLTIESVVIGPFTASHNYAYYGEGRGDALRVCDLAAEALAAAHAAGFDFSRCDADGDGAIDGFDMIHAGWGAEAQANASYSDYIWAQSWDLRSPVTYDGVTISSYQTEGELRGAESKTPVGITSVGSICHETGHTLGLPDLYDTDGSSSGAGDFCLMASGSWCGPNDDGTVPCHPSAWCKAYLGWLEPIEVSESDAYALARVEDHAVVAKLHGNFSSAKEYFLLENRQGVGFDSHLPGTKRGLLIWHVDDAVSGNDNERHYQVDLEEASGTQDLERGTNQGTDADYFRSDTLTSFTSTTTPNNLGYRNERLGLSVLDVGSSRDEMSFRIEKSVEKAGFTVEDGVLLAWNGLGSTDVVIPSDVGARSIAAQAFYGNRALTSVSIPGCVTNVGLEAFAGCGKLTNLVLNAGLKTIGEGAFYMCPKLSGRLYVPATVREIGTEAFAITAFDSVVFMGTPTSLGGAVFYGCRSLAKVYFKGNAPSFTGCFRPGGWRSVYDGTPTALVSYVPVGSVGWSETGSTLVPDLWPLGDWRDARAIRSYTPTFTVTQAKNDGSGLTRSQTYELGYSKCLLWKDSQLGWSRTGFDFLGWGLASDDAEPVCANGARLLDPVDPGETLSLYALWTNVSHVVRLNRNDGSGVVRDQIFKTGIAQHLLWKDSQLGWTRSGYSFLGWMSSSGGGLVRYANGERVKDLAAVGQTNNLFAAWLGAGNSRVVYHRNFTVADTTQQSDLFRRGVTRRLAWKDSQLGWTRSGYAFLGWAPQASPMLVTYSNGASVRDLAADGKTLHLYAVWLGADTYKIVFHRNRSADDADVCVQGARRDQSTRLAWKDSQLGWANPSGKRFMGWATSAGATSASYANGATVSNLAPSGKAADLYAVWK